ncbi:MAG: cytochrome c family protein [Alphaproteobacteria bacterium]|nr:cytochrome c family protein [Alphaproteobacteria bacterium]
MRSSSLPRIFGLVILVAVLQTACEEADKKTEGTAGDPAAEMESMLQSFEKAVEQEAAEKTAPAKVAAAAATGGGDPEAGQKVFRKCKVCHTAEKGGPHKAGPNLWNVVGRKKGGAEGFSYSTAMQEAGGTWTEADLNAYLASPKQFLPGNRMAFAGIRKPEDRADLIAYLKSLAD